MNTLKNSKEDLCGIYSIKNPIGKYYIGSSKKIYRRWSQHGENNKSMPKLSNSFVLYGKKNHEFKIICICTEDELIKNEVIFQLIFKSVEDGLNITYADRRRWKPKPESIEKMRQTKKGAKLSYEHKQKISSSLKGRKQKPRAREHIDKITTKIKGGKLNLSDEQRAKRRIQVSQIVRTNGQKVMCTKTGIIYDTIGKAAKANNVNVGALRWWFKHPRLNKTTLIKVTD